MNCEKCGQETFLPFRCPYCGCQFCDAHRLPENHDCSRMDLARSPSQAEVIGQPKVSSYEYSVTFGQPRRVQNRVYISPTEAKHLAVAALLVVAIGFSIAFYAGYMETYSFGWTWTVTSVFAVVLMASFLVHEMAHKVASQRRGLWAEFRLTTWGAVLTLISVVLPFKLISPGAVMISGPARLEDVGKISIAGPITNMAFSATFLGISFAVEPLSWWWLFVALAMFNATIAIFNLIPIGILDGFKIFSWNRKVWALAFAVAVALAVPAYVLASRFMYFF